MTTEPRDDKQILELIARHDRAALDELYAKYANTVFSLSMHMLRERGAAEEVTQDVFFNVWRRAASYHPSRGTVTAWLFSIAHHRAIDELRKRRRDQTHVQHGVDLSNKPSNGDGDPVAYAKLQFEQSYLKGALADLRPEQREVVVLAYFGGLTHSEISRSLGQPLGTVKTRMRLAIKKLKEILEPQVTEWADSGM